MDGQKVLLKLSSLSIEYFCFNNTLIQENGTPLDLMSKIKSHTLCMF